MAEENDGSGEAEKAREGEPTDMTEYLMHMAKALQALEVGFPDPKQLDERIPLIARLRGTAPDIRNIIKAGVQLEAMDAIAENRDFNWDKAMKHPLIQSFLRYTPSLPRKQGGGGREELVTMVRTGGSPEKKPWWQIGGGH